ncbi:MAG: thiolase family protein [Chloracidobacterium sp.]|nr:thiolase family protein [Chloracidobacterium sp.]
MKAFVVEAKRTAIGRSHPDKGVFRDVRADELLAALIMRVVDNGITSEYIDDVYIGCVGQHLEQGKNIARLAALLAGLPETVPATTINRLCASGLQAFNFAVSTIESGHADVILAGGVEHMHHVPMMASIDYNEYLLDRYAFPFTNMGLTAENVAESFAISRKEQDVFAFESHQKAITAQEAGRFDREIIAIETSDGLAGTDQSPRATTDIETLAGLKAVFKDGGTVTAGNSSPLNDGASLTLLASDYACQRHGLKKKAEVLDYCVVGLDPCQMGLGPVPAIRRLLKDNDLTVKDIDRFEMNEAFASQAIACIRQLGLPPERVNPWGGAIALGHPLGATGTRLIATLLNGLIADDQELGIASLCIGHGQGMATLIRRV